MELTPAQRKHACTVLVRETGFLILAVDPERRQGESDDTNNYLALPITLTAPDLSPTGLTAPAAAISGEEIQVSWTVMNSSDVAAPGEWQDVVYLSDDPFFDDNDRYLWSEYKDDNTTLDAHQSYTYTRDIQVDGRTAGGTKYVLLVTDRYKSQFETDETNNVLAVPIQIAVPDLTISAISPNQAAVGQAINVSWTVTNSGDVPTLSGWRDYAYLSLDPFFGSGDQNVDSFYHGDSVASGGSYTVDRTVTIPGNTSTQWRYLLIVADGSQDLGETNESNNVVALPLSLSAPDVTVTTLEAPATVTVGQQVQFTWTVENVGDTTAYGDWNDYLYIGNRNIGNSSAAGFTPLEAGASYTFAQNHDGPGKPSPHKQRTAAPRRWQQPTNRNE